MLGLLIYPDCICNCPINGQDQLPSYTVRCLVKRLLFARVSIMGIDCGVLYIYGRVTIARRSTFFGSTSDQLPACPEMVCMRKNLAFEWANLIFLFSSIFLLGINLFSTGGFAISMRYIAFSPPKPLLTQHKYRLLYLITGFDDGRLSFVWQLDVFSPGSN